MYVSLMRKPMHSFESPAAYSCLKFYGQFVRLLRTAQQSPTVCRAQFAVCTVANSQCSPIFLWTAVAIPCQGPWIDIIPLTDGHGGDVVQEGT